ncbi:prepilin-type N-terminal cleavage/methylation domain-containing protein, partial [Candidatus Saccharibacteria bacterium]|nr:prepilin-type N-terminal cleavage/methylation domain-containing protein [Candidatus Saccharibacteria bacterium]
MKTTTHSGFTLTELLVATAIIALCLIISAPLYRDYLVETETVDALSALKALELEVRAPAKSGDRLQVCDDSLVKTENLQSNYLRLGIVAVPNAPANPAGEKGFAAAMNVISTVDKEGSTGVRVAKAFYEEIKNSRPSELVEGTVADTAVAFAVILSPIGEPYCETPGQSKLAAGPGSSSHLNHEAAKNVVQTTAVV